MVRRCCRIDKMVTSVWSPLLACVIGTSTIYIVGVLVIEVVLENFCLFQVELLFGLSKYKSEVICR